MSAFRVGPGGTLTFNGEQIANFVPQLVHIFEDAARGAAGPLAALQVEFVIENQDHKQSVTIKYEDLDKFNFEVAFPGCICSNSKGHSTKKLVVRYIREQLGRAIEAGADGTYYAAPGWYTQPSGMKYVIGNQIIGQRAERSFRISPVVSQVSLCSNPQLAPCDAAEMLFKAIERFSRITLPVYAFTLYASLRSVMRKEGLPTACVLYLVGNQGYGKTETAKRFCALYQDDTGTYTNIYDLHSTEAAMRNAAAGARDQIIVLDDICKSTNKQDQRQRRDFAASLIKASTNGTPVTYMQGRAVKAVECAASLVITGEFPLEEASELIRCVTISIDQQLTGGDDSDRMVAASALESFLQWFSEHAEEELNLLRKDYRSFKTKERSHREERLQISLWELSWVFGSFLRFAVSVGAISQHASEKIDKTLTSILLQIFSDTLHRIEKLHSNPLSALAAVIKAGAVTKKFPYFLHNGCLCVRTEDLTAYLQKVSGNSMLTTNDITALLRQKNLLCMDNTGKSTRKVNGVRVLTIPRDKLQ